MSLNNAIAFIDKVMNDDTYRHGFYQFRSVSEIEQVLRTEGLLFNYGHFEDAINKMVLDSQDEEEANTYRQIEGWWNILLQMLS